ncbi:MAG: hypothetical protein ACLP5H_10340, partial [Desulfomonilaceae bacterium]
MKSKILCCAAVLVFALCLVAPAIAADVAEGKCISYDKDKKIIVIEDYDTNFSAEHKFGKPTGKQSTYDMTGSLIGIPPNPGDIVRIAYEQKDNQRHAVRLMNVTKQDLMKK